MNDSVLLQGRVSAKAAEAARRTNRKLQLSSFEEVCLCLVSALQP